MLNNKMKTFCNKGISVLEILMVIAIISILAVLIIPNMSKFKNEQTLKNTTEEIVSLLNKAKLDSNSFLDASLYSVYFEDDRAVYFKGTTFSESNPTNEIIIFNSSISIPSADGLNLVNTISPNTITFPRLTEDVRGYGSIILRMTSDPTREKTISISKLGTISSN